MAITMKQIAEATGLSRQTVGRILQGSDAFREDTRLKVLKAANRLGYRPNASARAMRTGRSDCIAILRGLKVNHLPPALLNALETATESRSLNLIISRLDDTGMYDDNPLPALFRQLLADGLIVLFQSEPPPELAGILNTYRIPAIWVNLKRQADCIYPDDRGATHMGTSRLTRAGHTRIGYLDPGFARDDAPHCSRLDRFAGYEDAMKQRRLRPRLITTRNSDVKKQVVDLLEPWLTGPDRMTAIVSHSANYAVGCYFVALRLGLRVPRDLSIVTVADDAMRLPDGMRGTVCRLPWAQIGRRGVELLQRKIDAPETSIPPEEVPCEWVRGATLAPPR